MGYPVAVTAVGIIELYQVAGDVTPEPPPTATSMKIHVLGCRVCNSLPSMQSKDALSAWEESPS